MTTLEHTQTIQELIEKSDRQFAAGEYRKGSETLWRAAELAMTAVAQQRGWEHSDYKELRQAVKCLAQEQGYESLFAEFDVARMFHDNFNHGFFEDYEPDAFKPIVHDFVHRALSLVK